MTRILALACAVGLLGGCLFVHREPGRGRARSGCAPAHHWEDGRCVHNGDGRGNGHGKGHDRGRGHDRD